MSAEKTVEKKRGRRWRRGKDEDVVEASAEVVDEDVEERGLTERKGRATPSRRREVDSPPTGGNLATRFGGGLREYFGGVASEIQKVSWPTREDIRRLSVIVIITTVTFSVFLGGLSFLFTELFRIGLADPIVLGAVLVVILGAGGWYLIYSNRR